MNAARRFKLTFHICCLGGGKNFVSFLPTKIFGGINENETKVKHFIFLWKSVPCCDIVVILRLLQFKGGGDSL